MKHVLVFAGALSALMLASPAAAQTVYQTGFEQPDFTTGPVNGQGGWTGVGEIQDTVTYSGTQALRIDDQNDSPIELDNILNVNLPATGIIDVHVAYMHAGPGGAQAGIGFEGDTGFIAQLAEGQGLYLVGNTDNATPYQSFAGDVWHQLFFRMDFTTGMVTGSVDGISLGAIAINNAVMPTTVTNFYLYSYPSGSDTVQSAYFDDLTISVSPGVPEPASWALMLGGFGLIGGAMRARRGAVVRFG